MRNSKVTPVSHGVYCNKQMILHVLCLAYISRLMPKRRMICQLTPKSCLMYAGLRRAKTFVCCCPDQLNKRLADSKIESVRRLLCSVRANSTFVVASSQSQRVAFMMRSATVTVAINNYGGLVDRITRVYVALPTTCRSAFSAVFVSAGVADEATQ